MKLDKDILGSKKVIVVAAVFLLVNILIYNLAISETIYHFVEIQELEAKNEQLENVHQRISKLETEISILEQNLGKGSPEATMALTKYLTDYCFEKKLELKSIPPTLNQNNSGLNFQYQTFSVVGSLKSLLSLIYEIENNALFGKVISLNLFTKTHPRTRRKTLTAMVTVQNILIPQNEG